MEEFFNGDNYTQLINEFEFEEEEETQDTAEYTHERFEEARSRITAEISEFFSSFWSNPVFDHIHLYKDDATACTDDVNKQAWMMSVSFTGSLDDVFTCLYWTQNSSG